MRYAAFGIALFACVTCDGASGKELLSTDAGHLQKTQAPDQARLSKASKRAPKASRTVSHPLPLSSAEAYASEHSSAPSVSVGRPASPATSSWTGFYLGAGVGGAPQ